MAPDIEAVKHLLQENKIWAAVQHHIAYYHAPQVIFNTNNVTLRIRFNSTVGKGNQSI